VTQDAVHEIIQRALEDAEFRGRLAVAPAEVLAGYELTDEERARFTSGTAHAERLEERMSKSDLTAAISAKTSSPSLPPRSRERSG